MGFNGYNIPQTMHSLQYRSPIKSKLNQNSYYGTPGRMNVNQLAPTTVQDIQQVAQIFEGMRLDAIQSSPQPLAQASPRPATIQRIQNFNPQLNHSFDRSPSRQLQVKICAREGCHQPRAIVEDGRVMANYCSKYCDDLDQNKGAFTKNQDEIYRKASRLIHEKNRSKSPIKMHGQSRNGMSPLREQRSRSPIHNRTVQNIQKNRSVFSSDESGFESDTYKTPQIQRQQTLPFGDYYGQANDSMIRQLNYDSNQSAQKNNQPIQLQNSLGAFGDSAFEKFVRSQTKDQKNSSSHQNSIYDTPSTNAYSSFSNQKQGFGNYNGYDEYYNNSNQKIIPQNLTIHQQYQHSVIQDNLIMDAKLDIYLAPNDPNKCINPPCRNRRFLINGMYLPVCSRKCANVMNIAFNN